MAGSTKDVAFKYVVVGLLICVHYVNCGDPAGKFRLIEQSGAQFNRILKTLRTTVELAGSQRPTWVSEHMGHPLTLGS